MLTPEFLIRQHDDLGDYFLNLVRYFVENLTYNVGEDSTVMPRFNALTKNHKLVVKQDRTLKPVCETRFENDNVVMYIRSTEWDMGDAGADVKAALGRVAAQAAPVLQPPPLKACIRLQLTL